MWQITIQMRDEAGHKAPMSYERDTVTDVIRLVSIGLELGCGVSVEEVL